MARANNYRGSHLWLISCSLHLDLRGMGGQNRYVKFGYRTYTSPLHRLRISEETAGTKKEVILFAKSVKFIFMMGRKQRREVRGGALNR